MEKLNSEDTIEEEDELSEIKDTKKPIITFAKLNKYFFILILSPIFFMLTNFFQYLIHLLYQILPYFEKGSLAFYFALFFQTLNHLLF